ncbi:MAG TPA: multicopper oxidase domain-containing protein [Verrucomicrobiota bacterium]|nr:copper oxidase [Verrucomicrobiales bacterium]HRI13374.1 multicopper oxidase domain-containing protein [Verrucomicrobiota bacterium]
MKHTLILVALAGGLLTALGQHHNGGGSTEFGGDPITNIVPFVDPLPIPAFAVPTGTINGAPVYELAMTEFMHRFHRDLPEMPVWGYGGSYPGPTIQAVVNQPIYVRWIDQLPVHYPPWLPPNPINHGVHGDLVQNVVHLHGGANRPEFDGHPEAWFRPGESRTYLYENIDFGGDGETLWYHDHAIGVTEINVYAGLAGFYWLRNPDAEAPLDLPSGPYEIPLVIQDRDLQTNHPPASLLSIGVLPWHYLPVVNGKVAPYLEVEPRKYRFRILNGSGFRTIGLVLYANGQNVPIDQIGTDDGFLAKPIRIAMTNNVLQTLRLMPAERADVIVDFGGLADGTHVVMTNQFDSTSVALPPAEPLNVVGGNFMEFRVHRRDSNPDPSRLPDVLTTNVVNPQLLAARAVRTRTITLDLRNETPYPGLAFDTDTNVFALINLMHFDDPVTETPRGGDVEIWQIVNLSDDPHPIHVHLLDFFILDRLNFTANGAAEYINDRKLGRLKPLTSYLTGSSRFVQPNELGPKDVVRTPPKAVTRIVMEWPRDPRFYGNYVYHCHILDHEDNDMMRPLTVRPPLEPGQMLADFDLLTGLPLIEVGTAKGIPYVIQAASTPTGFFPINETIGTGQTYYLVDPPVAESRAKFYRTLTGP